MAVIIEGGVSAALLDVGVAEAVPAQVTMKPVAHYRDYGHYVSSNRFNIVGSQVANSALWSVKNLAFTGSRKYNLVIPLRFDLSWIQTTGTTSSALKQLQLSYILDFFGAFTVSIFDPALIVKRAPPITEFGNNALIRTVPVAGNSSGMAGQTIVEEAGKLAVVDLWNVQTMSGTEQNRIDVRLLDDVNGQHPLVIAPNEGLLLRAHESGATAHTSTVAWTFEWVEVPVY